MSESSLHSPKEFKMYIDGKWREGRDSARLQLINPSDENIWATAPNGTRADVDDAVKAADRAFNEGPWSRMSGKERGRYLYRLAEAIRGIGSELAEIETTDTGKLLRETQWQADNISSTYEYYAGVADKVHGELVDLDAGDMSALIRYEPLGVVAGIVPWNSQLHLASYKIAPALAAGNTIVIKASDDAPCALLAFARAIEQADLPRGVVNIISGMGVPCGEELVRHPLVRRVSFTGGVETARHIVRGTAENLARISLELGGKSPFIVFDDADLDSATNGILAGIFAATGQSCVAGSRLFLHRKIYDRVMESLIEGVGRIQIGDPFDKHTDMGPLATARQIERIETILGDSIGSACRLLVGGGRSQTMQRGYYFEPTILSCDHQDIPAAREELFGPVLCVFPFESEDEVVAMANDSQFAFAGGVFTRDIGRAMRLARAIRAGRIWVNTYRVASVKVPFGGFKNSGYGREAGLGAVRDYMDSKGIVMNFSDEPMKDPFVMR
jgi:(Z)-2-((N-methylformamido)methylene)-5-hydroxybutyrolactone dehydrogenase